MVDLVEVRRDEKLSDLLARMQEEQLLLTKHAQAPIFEIAKRLGQKSDRAREMYSGAFERQVFDWAPGAGAGSPNPYENYNIIQRKPWGNIGLAWLRGLGGDDGVTATVWLWWDDRNVKSEKVDAWIAEFCAILQWMTDDKLGEKLVGESWSLMDNA